MSKEEKIIKQIAAVFDGPKCNNRTRLQDIKREHVYNDIINRIGCNMFKWEGLPDDFLTSCSSMLMELAINCGVAVVYKVPAGISTVNSGKWTCTPLGFTGQLRNDGTAEHFITYGSDYSVTDQQLDKYVIIKNDAYMSCEYDVTEWYASMLADTDTSERALIRWSRMTPIAKATSGIEAGQLEQVMREVYNGAPFKVLSDNTKLVTGGGAASRDDMVLRLTDEGAIDRMHFLSEFHYELVRRICNLYNMPFHTTAKSAQNLESEVHNTDVFSQALSEIRIEEREKAAEEMRSVFGWDVSVRYGETIKKENEIIDSNVKEEVNEGEEPPAEDPTPAEDPGEDGEPTNDE